MDRRSRGLETPGPGLPPPSTPHFSQDPARAPAGAPQTRVEEAGMALGEAPGEDPGLALGKVPADIFYSKLNFIFNLIASNPSSLQKMHKAKGN